MNEQQEWKKCSSCKNSIFCNSKYFVCSVSSCNGNRTGYVFCSVSCFDQHIPMARHKDAGAIEETAPSKTSANTTNLNSPKGQRRIIKTNNKLSPPSNRQISKGGEILVIASRLKDFINEQSDFNTSAAVMNVLSDHIRYVVMQAIDNAREEGRKTVMDSDLKFLEKLNLNI